jgi:hypothetical protein
MVMTTMMMMMMNAKSEMDNINHSFSLHLCRIIILCDNLSVATSCWLVYHIIGPYIRL